MILWPLVAVVGFLLVNWLVIVLGTGSTARYEAERLQAAPVQDPGARRPAA